MSAKAWDRRRRNQRLWIAINKGMKAIHAEPWITVMLPQGLCLMSYNKYQLFQSLAELKKTA